MTRRGFFGLAVAGLAGLAAGALAKFMPKAAPKQAIDFLPSTGLLCQLPDSVEPNPFFTRPKAETVSDAFVEVLRGYEAHLKKRDLGFIRVKFDGENYADITFRDTQMRTARKRAAAKE